MQTGLKLCHHHFNRSESISSRVGEETGEYDD